MSIQNIADLQKDLMHMYEQLRSGSIEPKDAVEANNTAGKIIGSVKVQLAYHAMRNEVPRIPFLDGAIEVRKPIVAPLDQKQ